MYLYFEVRIDCFIANAISLDFSTKGRVDWLIQGGVLGFAFGEVAKNSDRTQRRSNFVGQV